MRVATRSDKLGALALVALAFAPFAFVACQTTFENPDGPYGGDALLYHVEKDVPAAFETVDAFLKFEFENRATLPAEVAEIARQVRAKAKPAFESINAARDEYVAAKAAFAAAKTASAQESAVLELDEKEAALKLKYDLTDWALKLATELLAKHRRP